MGIDESGTLAALKAHRAQFVDPAVVAPGVKSRLPPGVPIAALNGRHRAGLAASVPAASRRFQW